MRATGPSNNMTPTGPSDYMRPRGPSTPRTARTTVLAMLLFALVSSLPKAAAGPGPSPINSGSGKWWPEWDEDEETTLASPEVNISTAEGHTASLPCRVLHLQDKTISWIRAADLTVLAVDRTTVTTDSRFSVKHPEKTGDWILEINSASIKDSGTYDCQVNTYPKKSTRVHLKVLSQTDEHVFLEIPASDSEAPQKIEVVTPTAYMQPRENSRRSEDDSSERHAISLTILGSRWAEVMAGKTLGLSCVASGESIREAHASSRSPDSPLIEWTLDDVPVKLLFKNDKVEINENWQAGSVLSQLTLFDLRVEDSGTFGCHAPHAVTQAIPVTVLYPGHKTSYNSYERMKHSRKDFEQSKISYSESRRLHQMDAALGRQEDTLDALRGSSDAPQHYGDQPRGATASCSSHRTVVISGAVMLAIMLINCALCVAMYCKAH